MAKQFSSFSIFLLLLLAFQEMIPGEATVCSAPSKLFRGLCFRRSNCSAICEKESFLYGLCKGLECVCYKDCNNGGGGGGSSGGSGGDGGSGGSGDGGSGGGGDGGSGGDGGDPGQGPPDQGDGN